MSNTIYKSQSRVLARVGTPDGLKIEIGMKRANPVDFAD
tara:strand:+ start:1244 stop:1360 length:117 start_codon:yes stop_codon:yes gene_type:complete